MTNVELEVAPAIGSASAEIILPLKLGIVNDSRWDLRWRRSEPLAIRGPACFSDVSELCPNAIR